jgi:DNA-repair protein complementing XP-A cells
MSSNPNLTPAQARVAAVNRLKAKDRLVGAPPTSVAAGKGGTAGAETGAKKGAPILKTSRNAVEGQKIEEAPLKRSSGLVSCRRAMFRLGERAL